MARGTVLSLVALAAPLFVGCSDTPSTNTFDASARDASARDITTADLPAADVPATMEPTPVVPVGIDAFRQIARMPVVRIGTRTYLRSTYDRTGGNEGADASHFLREERSDFNVTLDVEGQGALDFVRTNHWHGSPWHYGVDGMDQVVTESSTADPDHPVAGSIFLPSAPLPSPLTWTWSTTQGADLNWVPIEFQRSLTLGYGRTHYGTGYYIFQSFPKDATNLTHPLHTWDGRTPPSQDVLDLLNAAHAGAASVRPFLHGDTDATGTAALPASGSVRLADLAGPAVIRRLSLSVDPARAVDLGRATIRITWDDRSRPSVEAPIALFFGAGTLFSRDPAALRGAGMVRGLFSSIAVVDGAMVLEFRAPMPFFHHAVVELVGNGVAIPDIHWLASTSAWTDSPTVTGYLHATYVDHTAPMPGRDLVFLDTVGAEGERDWCGLFFGTSFVFSDRAELTTLEGDPRFFFDDSQTPQAQGTGTEEWGGGGDYWGGVTMSLPLAGHPTGAPSPGAAMNAEDQIESVYRFLVADAFPFGRNARIQFEHGGEDDSAEHYRSVTYWYGRPGACLVPTDHLHVGDAADEALHRYVATGTTAVDTLTSRYELGVDTLPNGTVVVPTSTDTGRHTVGATVFTVAIDPLNRGVLLRRTLDYGYPDQRAEIFVADDVPDGAFESAGIWYTAGSNRCVQSNPAAELGAVEPAVQTSNRRWRDDEFLLPARLTAGRSAIRVRAVWSPMPHPLTPGAAALPSAWSEYRYTAYSYRL